MASSVSNPLASLIESRKRKNKNNAATLRKLHKTHGEANISDEDMARFFELDPERAAERGLPVLMTKAQWLEIMHELGTAPVNDLYRRSGALPKIPKRPARPSPGERARASAAEWKVAMQRSAASRAASAAASRASSAAASGASSAAASGASAASMGSNGSSGAPGPPLALLPRAPAGAESNAAAAALQSGLGNYPNSPRAGDPAGAASSSRATSRLTVNSPAASFGAPSNGSRVINMLSAASTEAFRQNWIREAQRRAAARSRAAAPGPGGKRKTRRSHKTRRQRK